jgi:glutaredoxin
MNEVKVYGADWCEDTKATRNHLDSFGVPYQYVDVEQDRRAQDWVKQQNGGKQKTPTLDIGGQVLVEPNEQELELALRGKGLMA